jgi:hypothetical protein
VASPPLSFRSRARGDIEQGKGTARRTTEKDTRFLWRACARSLSPPSLPAWSVPGVSLSLSLSLSLFQSRSALLGSPLLRFSTGLPDFGRSGDTGEQQHTHTRNDTHSYNEQTPYQRRRAGILPPPGGRGGLGPLPGAGCAGTMAVLPLSSPRFCPVSYLCFCTAHPVRSSVSLCAMRIASFLFLACILLACAAQRSATAV